MTFHLTSRLWVSSDAFSFTPEQAAESLRTHSNTVVQVPSFDVGYKTLQILGVPDGEIDNICHFALTGELIDGSEQRSIF